MRNWRSTGGYKYVIFLLLFALFCSSCKKDEEDRPYFGGWITKKSIPALNGYAEVNYYLELSDNAFTESFLKYNGTSWRNWIFVSIEGSLSVSGNIMIFSAEKISFSTYNADTSTHAEPYAVYTKNDQDLNGMSSGFVLATAGNKAEYAVTRDGLSLKVDYNENDDFSDDHTAFLYKRQ